MFNNENYNVWEGQECGEWWEDAVEERRPALYQTREEWLDAATTAFMPKFSTLGLPNPAVKVACGWPSAGGLREKKKTIGECWHKDMVQQSTAHLFISPCLESPIAVLETLLHEVLHAALPLGTKHNKTFDSYSKKLGLEGPPTSNFAGTDLKARLNVLSHRLGVYPHHSIDRSLRKKAATRLRLWECQCEKPVKVRVASDDFQAICNHCEQAFIMREKD